jgi:hypothetical protein
VSEPAARRPAPSSLPVEGSAALSAANEPVARTSRQPRPTDSGPAYAAVVAGRAVPRQESRTLKPKPTGSDSPEPAASSEADRRRMSLGDVSGPLRGMPAGTTPDAHMDTNTGVPAGQRQNKTPSMLQASRRLGMFEGVMPQRSLAPDEG